MASPQVVRKNPRTWVRTMDRVPLELVANPTKLGTTTHTTTSISSLTKAGLGIGETARPPTYLGPSVPTIKEIGLSEY